MSRAGNLIRGLKKKLGITSGSAVRCPLCGGWAPPELAQLERGAGAKLEGTDGLPTCDVCTLPRALALVRTRRFRFGPRLGVKVVDLRGEPFGPHPLDPGRKDRSA
ncbi:MAG: hypothetical protein IT508_10885 [Burkholderiaceae bacterium]|nr:hypothetical protein [Burkholderiaceae bacterium]